MAKKKGKATRLAMDEVNVEDESDVSALNHTMNNEPTAKAVALEAESELPTEEPEATPDHISHTGTKQPRISPYASPPVVLEVGPGQATYYVPQHLLPSSSQGTVTLPGVSAETGHTLVHFFYTGAYETLEIAPDSPSAFKHALLAYMVAVMTELSGFEQLAKQQIEEHGSDMSLTVLLDTIPQDFEELEQSAWFYDYLRARVKEAFDTDHTQFTNEAFHQSVGKNALERFIMRYVVELFSKKLTTWEEERASLEKALDGLKPSLDKSRVLMRNVIEYEDDPEVRAVLNIPQSIGPNAGKTPPLANEVSQVEKSSHDFSSPQPPAQVPKKSKKNKKPEAGPAFDPKVKPAIEAEPRFTPEPEDYLPQPPLVDIWGIAQKKTLEPEPALYPTHTPQSNSLPKLDDHLAPQPFSPAVKKAKKKKSAPESAPEPEPKPESSSAGELAPEPADEPQPESGPSNPQPSFSGIKKKSKKEKLKEIKEKHKNQADSAREPEEQMPAPELKPTSEAQPELDPFNFQPLLQGVKKQFKKEKLKEMRRNEAKVREEMEERMKNETKRAEGIEEQARPVESTSTPLQDGNLSSEPMSTVSKKKGKMSAKARKLERKRLEEEQQQLVEEAWFATRMQSLSAITFERELRESISTHTPPLESASTPPVSQAELQ